VLNTIKIKADNILANQFHSELFFLKHKELSYFVSYSEIQNVTMNDKIILHYRDSSNRKIIERDTIRVITKLPNSEQSYKGKVKTHNYINRQKQSTTGKL
jgi:hypothetical protein